MELCKESEDMTIPGTIKLDVTKVNCISYKTELFCFCIEELKETDYLMNFLKQLDNFLPGFVFSKDNLIILEDRFSKGLTKKSPLEKAREFLQKTRGDRISDSGELGEFILYLFAREVKGAKKLISKIQSRGSSTITLPGRDGIYFWKDNSNNVYMLVGEAKMKPDSNDGLREAQNDINQFWNSQNVYHEINLASTHLRTEIDAENAQIYEAYFIDDNPKHKELKYRNLIFVGYNLQAFNQLVKKAINLTDFQTAVITDLKRCFSNQARLISASPCSSFYCFFPFENIQVARESFARHHQLMT